VRIARRIERHYGCPQDIEWAISAGADEGEDVFLLQSRPETVWAERERPSVAAPREKAFHHVMALFGSPARPAREGSR
jgi:pyruvate,water dikinase